MARTLGNESFLRFNDFFSLFKRRFQLPSWPEIVFSDEDMDFQTTCWLADWGLARSVISSQATKRNALTTNLRGARKQMKTFRNIAAAVFFFALAINTSAIAKTHRSPVTAQSASDASHRMQLIDQSLIDDGFKLATVAEHQINYIMAPEAPYAWGHLVYTYTRIVPGHFQMVEHIEVSTEVLSTADGFSFPQITIHELLSQ